MYVCVRDRNKESKRERERERERERKREREKPIFTSIYLGDWFILVLISENIDVTVFSQLIRNILEPYS